MNLIQPKPRAAGIDLSIGETQQRTHLGAHISYPSVNARRPGDIGHVFKNPPVLLFATAKRLFAYLDLGDILDGRALVCRAHRWIERR